MTFVISDLPQNQPLIIFSILLVPKFIIMLQRISLTAFLLFFVLSCGKDPVVSPTPNPTEKILNDINFPQFVPPIGLREGVTTNFSVSPLTDKAGKEISPNVSVVQGSATIPILSFRILLLLPTSTLTMITFINVK